MERHFRNVSEGRIFSSDRNIWKIIKPFLTNKGFIPISDISLKEGNEIITTDKDLPETINNHYVNIIAKTTGFKPHTDLHMFRDLYIDSAISKIKDTLVLKK